jgi:hypothetical protein
MNRIRKVPMRKDPIGFFDTSGANFIAAKLQLDSYRALLVGERIRDAEEILAEVSNAIMTAATAGNPESREIIGTARVYRRPCPEKDRLYRRFKAAESTWTEVSVAP